MEVILSQSVKGLGKAGDKVKVARGYGENYLMPKGIAVIATDSNSKMWEQKKKKLAKKEAVLRDEAQKLADKMNGKTIKIEAKVGAEDKLFGSITVKDIASAIKENLKLDIDKKNILIAEPIKTAGVFPVKIECHPEIEAELNIEVAGQQAEETEDKKSSKKKPTRTDAKKE